MTTPYEQQLREEWREIQKIGVDYGTFGKTTAFALDERTSDKLFDWLLTKHREFVKALRERLEDMEMDVPTEFQIGSENSTPRIIRANGRNDAIRDILSLPSLQITDKE